jgi:hypothetical protein
MPNTDNCPVMPATIRKRDVEKYYRISAATRCRLQRVGRLPAFDVFLGALECWQAETMPDVAAWIARSRLQFPVHVSTAEIERHLSNSTEMHL